MSVYLIGGVPYSDELYHHGVKGQRWHIRKYVDANGHLTALGKEHYGIGDKSSSTSSSASKPQVSSVWAGYKNGKQYAQSSLNSTSVRNAAAGSKASTVQNGKTAVEKKLGGFTTMKTNEGLSTTAIREALAKKRADEAKKDEKKTTTAVATDDTATTITKDKSKKSTKAKATKKTSTAKKTTSKKKKTKKSASTSTASAKKTVERVGSTTKVSDLKTAGTSASRKSGDDFLKKYRIKTR